MSGPRKRAQRQYFPHLNFYVTLKQKVEFTHNTKHCIPFCYCLGFVSVDVHIFTELIQGIHYPVYYVYSTFTSLRHIHLDTHSCLSVDQIHII